MVLYVRAVLQRRKRNKHEQRKSPEERSAVGPSTTVPKQKMNIESTPPDPPPNPHPKGKPSLLPRLTASVSAGGRMKEVTFPSCFRAYPTYCMGGSSLTAIASKCCSRPPIKKMD